MVKPAQSVEVDVAGRRLRLTNLDKVLWPATGFTKGEMIDYYARIAPVLLPHIAGRPLTLKRFPNGVGGSSFFEKNCPSHRPEWVPTITMGEVSYCNIEEPAAVVWLANLAAIELHPTLAAAPCLDQPLSVVFDLDPGAPADVIACAKVALMLREALDRLGLAAWVKTSGSKGLQVYVPLNRKVGYEQTRGFSLALARITETSHPDLVVTSQEKRLRVGKVLIDWSQNASSKTTVSVYSLRARDAPTVSTPLQWSEVEAADASGDPSVLTFQAAQTLERVSASGDLMEPLLRVEQDLPRLTAP